MPRPPRVQYENAFYHVMNRGRGRRWIFHGEAYYEAFLGTLEEERNSGSSLANTTSAATHSPMLHLQDLTPDRFFYLRSVISLNFPLPF